MAHTNESLDELIERMFSPENVGIASGFLGGGIRNIGRGAKGLPTKPATKVTLRPAFRGADGQVFPGNPGTLHANILDGNPGLFRLFADGTLEDGFILPDGEFVNRVEAKQIAIQNDLLNTQGKNTAHPNLDSIHLKDSVSKGRVRPIDTMEELQIQGKNLRDMLRAMRTLQDEQAFINNADDMAQVDKALEIVEQKISKIRGGQ